MVSDSLVEFIEKRYDHFKPKSLEELQKFLDKEKYLTDSARTKAFAIFETRIGGFGEVEEEEPEVVIEMEVIKETRKYRHERYSRGDTEWVMKRDKETGRFKKKVI